ncbi:hypothetical protein I5412_10015 [Citrobacter koseri]|uniref:hypothetical protein n=1 Tax=Citrobacter koseri TaxID=545 RepID=UPI00190898FA|nr:hypothetical protein [Citrobacter koseri]MBJ8875310.1 hypothetical protein [Citrobacter koseri]
MTTITREQAKDLRNAFECWQQDYDPAADKEQYEMFGLGVVAMDVLLASLDAGSNSHPASGPLSNDRLHRIREILGKAAAQRDGGNIGYAMSDAVKAIDELLEVRKAEPVGYYRKGSDGFYFASPTEQRPGTIPLYTATPAPVFPATLPCAVELKPGLIIGKGCKTEILLTALQRRADYYAEIDAMTPEERAEHEANIEAFKAMLPQPVPIVNEDLYKLANHIASSKNGLPDEWQDWADEVEADIRRAAMINGGKS